MSVLWARLQLQAMFAGRKPSSTFSSFLRNINLAYLTQASCKLTLKVDVCFFDKNLTQLLPWITCSTALPRGEFLHSPPLLGDGPAHLCQVSCSGDCLPQHPSVWSNQKCVVWYCRLVLLFFLDHPLKSMMKGIQYQWYTENFIILKRSMCIICSCSCFSPT